MIVVGTEVISVGDGVTSVGFALGVNEGDCVGLVLGVIVAAVGLSVVKRMGLSHIVFEESHDHALALKGHDCTYPTLQYIVPD